ncbi:MAG: capsule biosynthesis protein [Rubellimicrobium sp.]|nr:capsule biosynthesis protein [Rubellimicrobium sp.]
MTTRPKALKFRIRRTAPAAAGAANGSATGAPRTEVRVSAFPPAHTGAPAGATAPGAPAASGVRDMIGALRSGGQRPAASPAPERAAKGAAEPAPAPAPAHPPAAAQTGTVQTGTALTASSEQELEAIRQEGLTGRQLRMARRVAQKHGLEVASDYDAVRQLRARGVDPFQMNRILELVQPAAAQGAAGAALGRIQLPQTVPAKGQHNLPSTEIMTPQRAAAQRRSDEIMRIQRDIARRRQRKVAALLTRLTFFILLPTLLVGWYFYTIATPMYATRSAFVIQQAQPASPVGGLGGLFQGTSMATQQDSIAVQDYLSSREAMLRLDAEHGFKAHFSQEGIDPIQRLDPQATNEEAYRAYLRHVRISYDPTEGIIRMEVIAADPATSQTFSEALIHYAEEQVDQLSLRLREDQMAGARQSYESAEARRAEALQTWLGIQQQVQQIDPVGETAARTAQISALETERQQAQLQLEQRLSVSRPNQAQVDALRSQIANIENLIAELRNEMTRAGEEGSSLAARNTELRLAEENYTFQTLMVQQALTQMETARVEANRQVRYLATGVPPIAPDVATYPRAFENTLLALLVLSGVYLMISLTASILREQVTS